MFRAQNIHYDMAAKAKGLNGAGLGALHLLVQRLGLAAALDGRLHLLKRHVPYFESDHVLNLTYNLPAGGRTINDLELLRNNCFGARTPTRWPAGPGRPTCAGPPGGRGWPARNCGTAGGRWSAST